MRTIVALGSVLFLGCGGPQGTHDKRGYCPKGAPATTPTTVSKVFTPGVGVGGITIGVSTLDDVVRTYGCDWSFKWTGVRDEKILIVSEGGGPGKPYRPTEFDFDTTTGTVKAIFINVDNSEIVSAKGNGIHPDPVTGSKFQPLQAFIDEFGQPTIKRTDAKFHAVHVAFPQGLELAHHDTEPYDVSSMTIVKASAPAARP